MKVEYTFDLIYLHQVSRIARVLDVPEVWPLLIAVDERTPQEERVKYTMIVGRMLAKKGCGSTRSDVHTSHYLTIFLAITSGVLDRFTKVSVDKRDEAMLPILGLFYNAIIRHNYDTERGKEGNPPDIGETMMWEDVFPLLDLVDHPGIDKSESIRNSVNSFAVSS